MRRNFWSTWWKKCGRGRWLLLGLLGLLVLPGCGHEEEGQVESVTTPPTVEVLQPRYKKIIRVVGQPSFVESYERTSIFPKVPGYIKKWNVDIGDKVKKGDVLCTLYAPEYEEDWETKKALVRLDERKVALAKQVVEVAKADVEAAEARLVEAEKILGKFEAQVERWDSEVKRLARIYRDGGVVDKQVLEESRNQLKASTAARDAAIATIAKAKAELLSRKATLAQDEIAVEVAEHDLKVAISNAKYAKAWVDYLKVTSPFDGIIVGRNANTEDLVTPTQGDPTADPHSPHLSPSGQSAPIYVVDRIDIVRIYVDIPEGDANYVQVGTKAKVQIKGYKNKWLNAEVTRTSWALNMKSRTLRAEIDLHNPVDEKGNAQILPGMYAYGRVTIERNVRAVPVSALVTSGDSTYYWAYDHGHTKKVEVQTGISDGDWIEITNRQGKATSADDDGWTEINGTENVILGDLSLLEEGSPVKVVDSSGAPRTITEAPSTPSGTPGTKSK